MIDVQRLVGRRIAVPASFVADTLTVTASQAGTSVELRVQGSIAESAKVFHSLDAQVSGSRVYLKVFASLAFWKRSGSPDFSTSKRLELPPGVVEVAYGDPSDFSLLTSIHVEDDTSSGEAGSRPR